MDRQSRSVKATNVKRLLLVAVIAGTAPGCASQRGSFFASGRQDSAASVVGEDGAGQDGSATDPLADQGPKSSVRPAGYSEHVLAATPIRINQADQGDSDNTESGLTRVQPPVGKSESGGVPTTSLSMQSTMDVQRQPVEYFVSTALARHPKLQAAQHRVAAATNVIPQAQSLPDPTLNNTFWPIQDQALQTAGGLVGHQMAISQMVPFPKKLKTKGVIASREVQIAQTEVDAIAREITESVRLAYYEVWFATRAIAIIEETKTLVDDLGEVAEARYRSGGSQQDVIRASLENDRLDDQLVTLRKQKMLAQADLATLLQNPTGPMPEAHQELNVDDTPQQIDALIALAEQCNPKLRGLAWEIQRDRDKQQLACLQKYPDFSVGLNWGLISDGPNAISPVADGHDNISFSFGTTLPIYRDKINAGIREAAHRTSSSTRRLEAERDELYGKLRRLIIQADALNEQRDIYENRIIPRTEDTLRLSIADYRGRRTDFFTLIETYRELLTFETQLARIDASLAGALAQIDRTVGCP